MDHGPCEGQLTLLWLQVWLRPVGRFRGPQGLGDRDITHILKVSEGLLDFHLRFLPEIFLFENIHVFILSLSLHQARLLCLF